MVVLVFENKVFGLFIFPEREGKEVTELVGSTETKGLPKLELELELIEFKFKFEAEGDLGCELERFVFEFDPHNWLSKFI